VEADGGRGSGLCGAEPAAGDAGKKKMKRRKKRDQCPAAVAATGSGERSSSITWFSITIL
jgi:hypothetical protein